MNTQEFSSTFLASVTDAQAVRALPLGHVVALGPGGGEVSILSGRVWLTSDGDPSDHVLDAGESFSVRDSGQTLVESWSRGGDPAVIAWKPRSFGQRLRDRFLHPAPRGWRLTGTARRVGIGTLAAVAGFVVPSFVFGPIPDAYVRALTAPAVHATTAVLHNAVDGIDTGDGASGVARQAGRGASVAA